MRRAQSLVPKCVSSRGLESESAEWGEREKTHSLPAAARHQLRPPDARSPGSPPLSPCSSFLPPPPPPLVHSFPYMLPLPSFLPIPLFSLLLLSFPPVSPIPPSVPINSPLKKKTPAVFRKSAQSTAQAEAAQPSQDARTQGRLSQPKHTGMSTLSEGSLLQDFYSPFRTRVPRRGCGSRCESCAAAGGVGTG